MAKLNELCGAGIAASNDKLLQSRLFAYADAQRYRLGVNYLQLPINQPHNCYHNNHNEGSIQFNDKIEEVSWSMFSTSGCLSAHQLPNHMSVDMRSRKSGLLYGQCHHQH